MLLSMIIHDFLVVRVDRLQMTGRWPGKAVDLPTEVWELIAQHMSLQQWDRIATICQASPSAKPAKNDMVVASHSALKCLRKYWGHARFLDLDIHPSKIPCLADFQAADLKRVEQLLLRFPQGYEYPSPLFVARLLSHTPALKVLALDVPDCVALPPLKNLQHVCLYLITLDDAAIRCLQNLSQLRTLRMQGNSNVQESIECAPVDLTRLPKLTNVALRNVIFREPGLLLPDGCLLCIYNDSCGYTKRFWEPNASKGQIDSLTLIQWTPRDLAVPSFLHETGCRVLLWGDADIGRLRILASILGPLLSTLRELYMEGPKMCMHLPRSLRVYALHLCASNLTITCEDPASLAHGLRDASFMYGALGEADVFEIAAAMAEVGKPMIAIPTAEIAHLEVEDDPNMHATYGIYYGVYYFQGEGWPCACGTCLECIGAL